MFSFDASLFFFPRPNYSMNRYLLSVIFLLSTNFVPKPIAIIIETFNKKNTH